MPAIERRFFFVRHGETDWNREGRLQGQRDLPLNGRGRDQSIAVGRRLAEIMDAQGLDPQRLDYVASPLGRTRATMELMRAALGLEPQAYRCDDRLKEIAFGRWEGQTWAEISAVDPARVKARKRDKWSAVPPGGESYAQLVERVRPWLETVDTDAVVVGHGGVARAILTLVTDLSPESAPQREIRQGRILLVAEGRADWD